MGVTGAGKTLIGEKLAAALCVDFFDGDDFHSAEAIAKMRSGVPLDDSDRLPWLGRIADRIRELDSRGESAVFACSALKETYRQILRSAAPAGHVRFVYLRASRELASARLHNRQGHYMPAQLVTSQFAALEEPAEAVALDAARPADEIVREIAKNLAADRDPEPGAKGG